MSHSACVVALSASAQTARIRSVPIRSGNGGRTEYAVSVPTEWRVLGLCTKTNKLQNAKRKERYDCFQKTILTFLGLGLEQSSVGRMLAENMQDPKSNSRNAKKINTRV